MLTISPLHNSKFDKTARRFCASMGLLIGLSACSDKPDDIVLEMDGLIIYGGDIVTMTEQAPDDPLPAEALLVQNDIIAGVSTLDHLRKVAPDATLIDLNGRALLPGFIDSHVHVRELGLDAIKADLVGVETVDEMVARLRAFYPELEPGQWLIGQGWDEGEFASRGYPDRAALDAAFPDNPVKLESLHGFAGFYNSQALQKANVKSDTPDPEGGTILRRPNGEPTGVMLALAQSLVNDIVPAPDQKQIEQAILAGLNIMADAGVTSIHEAGMTRQDVAAFKALAARGELPIRVYGMLNGNDPTLMSEWFEAGILDDQEDWLDIRSIKVFYDGSLGSRTALMKEPYADRPEIKVAAERISQPNMKQLGEQAASHRFQMAVHAIGDLGNDVTLNQFESILSKHEGFDHRWRIEHAQIVLPDFFERQSKQSVIASMQPSHAMGDSGWAEDRVGPERIKFGYAWRTILNHEGRLIFNSDLPGEPWTPMETLSFAVTRKKLDETPEAGWYADQALNVEESLRAMTIDGAYAAFQDERLGSLEPGKWADFVILDENPISIDPSQIKHITVEQVWVAGRRVK